MPAHDSAVATLHQAVAAALVRDVPAGAGIAVALSGGRDSVVLLAALRALAPTHAHALRAMHVNHGLSPASQRWSAFCGELCERWSIPFESTAVTVVRDAGTSLENEARRARYDALATIARAHACTHVALGHHRDDQAETLLLQLLRGAGPRGLAAMPAQRRDARGVTWWRPLLDVGRATIDAYIAATNLEYVEDESNARTRHRRNAIRHDVLPALAAVTPAAAAAIARAAQHQAEAVALADDLARIDAAAAIAHGTLARDALLALAPHRSRNLLRWFLRMHGLAAPSTARLAEVLAQFAHAGADSRAAVEHGGLVLALHRGRLHVHAPVPAPYAAEWRGEAALALPHGTLAFTRVDGDGIAADRLDGTLHVRPRAGGERFRLAADRPRRALKAILHDAGWPPWQRRSVPLLFAGERLVAVPGLGPDSDYAASAGTPGLVVTWQPRALADYVEPPPAGHAEPASLDHAGPHDPRASA